jgi:hypothetical protein
MSRLWVSARMAIVVATASALLTTLLPAAPAAAAGPVVVNDGDPRAYASSAPHMRALAEGSEVVGSGSGGYIGVTPEVVRSITAMPAGDVTTQVTGVGGVPETGVGAVVLNLAARNPTSTTEITVWQTGTTRPTIPNLGLAKWRAGTAMAIVAVDAAGRVSVNNKSGRVDLDVVVLGWFPTAQEFVPLPSTPIFDTKASPGRKLNANETYQVQVTGMGGIPLTGVGGVVLGLKSIDTTFLSSITVWPKGGTQPGIPDLVIDPLGSRTNAVVVAPGTGGAVLVHNTLGRTNLVIDVLGWLPSEGAFRAVPFAKLLDTQLAAGHSIDVQIAGVGGVPAKSATPGTPDPYAAVLDLYAPLAVLGTSLTAYSTGTDVPPALMLAAGIAQPAVGVTIVRLSDDGTITVRNNGPVRTRIVVGLRGWFAGPAMAGEIVVPANAVLPAPAQVDDAVLSHGVDGDVSGGTFLFEPGAFTIISPAARASGISAAEETDTIAVGDHVVFGVTDQTPEGYLGTVTTVQQVGDQVQIETTPAHLDEVFPSGDIDANLEPSDDTAPELAGQSETAGLHALDTPPSTAAAVAPPPPSKEAVNPKKSTDKVDENSPPNAKCSVSGGSIQTEFNLSFGYRIGLSFGRGGPYVTALASLGLGAGITVSDAAVTCQISKRLWGPKVKVFWLGFVPIVFTFELGTTLDIKAGIHATIGVSTATSITAGIDHNKVVKNLVLPTFKVEPDITQGQWLPSDLRAYAMVDLWLDFSVRLMGMFGPKFSVGPFAEFFVTTDTRSPLFGLDVGAAAKIVPSFKFLKYEKDFTGFEGEIPIAWIIDQISPGTVPPCEQVAGGYGPGLWRSGDWTLCRAALHDPDFTPPPWDLTHNTRMRSDGSHREGLIPGSFVADRFRILSYGQPLPLNSAAPASINLDFGTTYPGSRSSPGASQRLFTTSGFYTDTASGGDRIYWKVVSGMPPGMTLTKDAGTGDAVLSGTPTALGQYHLVAEPWYNRGDDLTPATNTYGPYPADYAQVTSDIVVSAGCEDVTATVTVPGTLSGQLACAGGAAGVTYAQVTGPANGTVSLFDASAGTFTYTPNPGFTGTDSFTYKATVGSVDTAPATFTIRVNAPPACPIEPMFTMTSEDTPLDDSVVSY